MSRFFKGTLILLIAGLITRILGFINRIVLARYVGEEGVGLFMMATPTLFLVIAATQIGLPVAISKFVAEASAEKNEKKVKTILVISLACTIFLSLIFTPLLFFGAKFLAKNLFTDARIYYPLIAMAPIIPISAVSAVLRGYFQGKQDMNPYAISLVLEQIVRILCIAYFTKKFLPYGIEYATAGAIISAIIGELISLLYLLARFKLRKTFKMRKHFFHYLFSGKEVFGELLSIAIPTTGSRMIGSIAWFLEPIVVAQSLAIAGVSTSFATKQYGELTGYALPLLMLPSFITISLGTTLIPAISEAYAKKQYQVVSYKLHHSLRFTFLSGALSTILMFVLSVPLMQVMYGTSHAAYYVKLLAPFFICFFYQGPLQAALQALDMANASMVNSFVGALVKTVLIFVLVTKANLGIVGVTLSMGIGIVLVTVLHFFAIAKRVRLYFFVREYVFTIIATISTGFLGVICQSHIFSSLSRIQNIMATTFVMVTVFLLFLILFGVVTRKEVEKIPIFGKIIAFVFL